MPGLIVACGRPDAAALARRMGEAMVRTPWDGVTLVADPSGRAALGVAGERGAALEVDGLLVALDGEVLGQHGPLDARAAARDLAAAFRARGERLATPEGSWSAAIWDPAAQALAIVTDDTASRPVALRRAGGVTLAAGEVKGLLAAGVAPDLDPDFWAQMLAYEHALPGRLSIAGAEGMPAATALVVDGGGERWHERWRFVPEPAGRRHEGFTDRLEDALGRAVARRATPGAVLAVSGGLDSRCMAVTAAAAPTQPTAVTYGAAGAADVELGRRVAALAGLRHRSLPLAPGWIARGAACTVWLSEGRQRCMHAHHLALRDLRADGVDAVLIGLMGDDVARAARPPSGPPGDAAWAAAVHRARATCLDDALLEEVLTTRFAARLRGRAADAVRRALAGMDGDRASRYGQFVFRTQAPHLMDDCMAVRDPFTDRAVLELFRRAPHALRADGQAERELLRRHPALARLPVAGDLPPPAARRRDRAGARATVVRRRVARRMRDTVGLPHPPDRRGLGDYRADLRHGGRALAEILLEPRTLARGQLREEPVRRLVERTLAGRTATTRALGVLLTLELFQRQFAEGDVPDCPLGLSASAA